MKNLTWLMILGLLSVPAFADYTEELNWTFELNEGGRISLENVNGNVEVTGVSGNTVEIIALKKAGTEEYLENLEILIEDSPDAIHIETDHPDSGIKGMFNWGKDSSGSVHFTLRVPASANLDEIESVNGDISIEGVSGTVRAGAVNGEIRASGLMGDANLETVNGSVDATFEKFGAGQKANCESVNGRLTVNLPADADVSVTAETINGGIDGSDFGLKVDKGFVGRDLAGDIGSGGGRLSMDTVNGAIKIRKR
jgi:DUF4097 and DUF4098 domain-containing protein YvlB